MKRAIVGVVMALCALASPVRATPITYDFTVTGTTGSLAGVTSNGTFSFDSSSIVLNGFNTNAGLLTDLAFVWNGITYTEANANTGALKWDASGNLLLAMFGNNCTAGSCSTAVLGQDVWLTKTGNLFDYRIPASAALGHGTFTFELAQPPARVPEPATLPLFGAAIALALAASFVPRKRRLVLAR